MDKLRIGNYVSPSHLDNCVGEVVKIDGDFITFTDLVTCRDVTYRRCELEKVTPAVVDRIVHKHTRPPLKYSN